MTKLFTPAKIGTCEIPNRLIVPAMVMNLCTEDGMITERYIKYIEEKAYVIKEGYQPRLDYLTIVDKVYFKGE